MTTMRALALPAVPPAFPTPPPNPRPLAKEIMKRIMLNMGSFARKPLAPERKPSAPEVRLVPIVSFLCFTIPVRLGPTYADISFKRRVGEALYRSVEDSRWI